MRRRRGGRRPRRRDDHRPRDRGKPTELDFTLSKRSAAAGKVTFRIANRGALKHEFKIARRKTKLLASGTSAKLTVTLRRGRYRYMCTVPGHAGRRHEGHAQGALKRPAVAAAAAGRRAARRPGAGTSRDPAAWNGRARGRV